jgi:murein DD-endopeptidase MepM/ murein hydrolase activator NlpD
VGAYDDGGMTASINAAKAAGIPTAAASYPATKVTVKPGDTLSEIAAANGLSTKQVLAMNPALTSNPKYNNGRTIFSGTKITVDPGYKAPPTPKPSVTKDPVVPPIPKPDPKPDETTTTTETTSTTETDTTTLTTSTIESSGESTSYSSINSVPYTPTAAAVVVSPPPPPTKTAPIDTVLFNDDSMSIEIMTDLIFEDIGGHELINIARNDIVNGQRISYTPIKNLGLIQQRYNPNNILNLQLTSEKYFNNFSIKLEEKVPKEGNGIDGSNIYFDETTGDLIIETVNMNPDEQLEVQISTNGTIYEANFGEITS